jgi:hypothetical protein
LVGWFVGCLLAWNFLYFSIFTGQRNYSFLPKSTPLRHAYFHYKNNCAFTKIRYMFRPMRQAVTQIYTKESRTNSERGLCLTQDCRINKSTIYLATKWPEVCES